MDTHFRKLFFRIIFLIITFVAVLSAKAQNSLHVAVLPPYTNQLADYANTPNKVVVIVTINGITTPNYSGKVFFRGKLRNASGDIEIATRPGFKPPMPVNVPTGPGGMPIPYTLTFSEIQNMFDWNNLDFKGISIDRIVQYGMEEDLYQFCVEVIDYVTNEVLVEERCGSPFNVALLEPPMILNPMNGMNIVRMEPQSVLFNWTISPGAPITTQYTLRMVEMTDGVNPNEALSTNNYPMRFFETTVTGNSFIYTGAAPKLDNGKTYAFAVIANDPVTNSMFRNNGISEIHTFKVENSPTITPPEIDQTNNELAFTTPHETNYIAEINSKQSYSVTWLWKELEEALRFLNNDDESVNVGIFDETIKEFYQKHKVEKYRLTFNTSGKEDPRVVARGKISLKEGTEIFTKDIPIYVSDTVSLLLAHHFTITDENAEESGFVSGNYYKATIQALTADNKVVADAQSVPFKYVRIPEDNFKIANIHAIVDYKIGGRPGTYHAINTPVTIRAYKFLMGNYGKATETLQLGEITTETNAEGVLNVDFKLPDVNDGDSVVFSMQTDSRYYLIGEFSETNAIMMGDTTRVSFGQQIAQTYGYSLKLQVRKKFTHDTKLHTDEVYDIPEGITVVLYRKNKKDYIPPVEGDINDYEHLSGLTEVARAITQIEIVKGKKVACVNFHNLLATPVTYVNLGHLTKTFYDEYYIKALQPDENLEVVGGNKSATGTIYDATKSASGTIYNATKSVVGSNSNNLQLKNDLKGQEVKYDAMKSVAGSGTNTGKFDQVETVVNTKDLSQATNDLHFDILRPFSHDGFTAEEMAYKLDFPKNLNSIDSLYRNVTAIYEIASTEPPTSYVKGSLSYKWHSDSSAVVRPMANTNFKIVVDYLIDGKMAYRTDKNSRGKYSFQYANGSAINLYDLGSVAGSGKTDAQGNFIINIPNFNVKGDLKKGVISDSYTSSSSNPGWQQDIANFDQPSTINWVLNNDLPLMQNDKGVLTGNTTQTSTPKSESVSLQRVFRIVPESPYYYPSMDYFTVQPLDSAEIPTQCSYVKEMSITVVPKDEAGKTLDEILMLVFRTPIDKATKAKMPIGEGDGNGLVQKLLNPQYKTATLGGTSGSTTTKSAWGNAQQEYSNDFFTKEFEYVCLQKGGDKENRGAATFSGLLAAFDDYYIEACSTPDKGTNHYGAAFISLGNVLNSSAQESKFEDPDRWLGIKGPPMIRNYFVNMKPLESRIFIRTIDNQTTQALPNTAITMRDLTGKIDISSTKRFTDNDGYLQIRFFEDPLNGSFNIVSNGLHEAYAQTAGNTTSTVNFEVRANATGYTSRLDTATINTTGSQWVKTMDLKPAGKLSVYVYSDETQTELKSDRFIGEIYGGLGEMQIFEKDLGKFVSTIPAKATEMEIIVPPGILHTLEQPSSDSGSTSWGFTGSTGLYDIDMLKLLTPVGKAESDKLDLKGKNFVPAYILVDSANMVEVSDGALYRHPVPSKVGTKIRVIPKDLAYFEEEYEISTVGNGIYVFQTPLLRKKHRIQFNVVDKDSKQAVSGVTVALGDVVKRDKEEPGKVFLEFENVSVNNYTFVIRGPNNSDYIPVTVNIKNEETKIPVLYSVQLEKGSSISGTVNLDGQPVKNAKVYLDISKETTSPTTMTFPVQMDEASQSFTQKTDQDKALVSTFTDAQGRYTLHGVPANNCKIEVIATLDTTFTVIGDSKQATISNKTATNVNLALKKYDKMQINNIYGFPLTIESLKEEGTNVRITGLVEWGAGISDFRVKDTYKQLRIEDVIFKAEMLDGQQVGVAVDASVKMQGVTNLKLRYLDGERQYNVLLKHKNSFIIHGRKEVSTDEELLIERGSDGGGVISGKMSIIDNSFNYTASYLNFTNGDDFYLADMKDGKLTNVIKTIISPLTETEAASVIGSENGDVSDSGNATGGVSTNGFAIVNPGAGFSQLYIATVNKRAIRQQKRLFYLSNSSGGPINFELLEFKAKAKPDSSYIAEDGKIHLNVDLSCEIANATPSKFDVNIKDMVLDNNDVYAASGSKLNVALGKWTLEVRDWSFDPKEGGIYSPNSIVRTEVMDVPAKLFILRNDRFLIDKFDYDNLQLGGGVVKVEVKKSLGNNALLWDNAVGSDMKGHWRLSITSKNPNNPAASATGFDNLKAASGLKDDDNKLKISYVQILDNNEATVSVASGQTFNIKGNALAKFKPQSLYNGSDYVNLSGVFNIDGIPVMNDMVLKLKYTGTTTATKQMKLTSVNLDFVPQGKVHFEAKEYNNNLNIRIESNKIEIDGFLSERPSPTFNPMPALLTAYPNTPPTGKQKYNIDISNRENPLEGKANWTTQMSKATATTPNVEVAPESEEGFRLEIGKGTADKINGMRVSGGNWTKLTYSGTLYDNQNSDGINGTEMTFTVFGDVTASSEKLNLSGMDTGFGKLSVKYEINNSRLIGDLNVGFVPLGAINIKHGTIRFVSDPIGFYIAGGFDTYVTVPIIAGDYNMGFMAGHYAPRKEVMKDIWDNYVQKYKSQELENKCYLDKIDHKLSGFYFGLDRVLFDTHLGYSIAGVGFDVRGYAGLGADFYTNFSPFTIGVSARAALKASAELSVLVAKVKGSANLNGAFDFDFIGDKFQANVNLGMGFDLKVQACAPFVGCATVFNGGFDCMAEAGVGSDGKPPRFSFKLSGGGVNMECPPSYGK